MRKILISLSLLTLVALTACVSTDQRQPADAALVIALPADVATLDLHRVNTVTSRQVLLHVHETLITQDEAGLQPGLALSWYQLDERTWEFHLREDVYFHNGAPFTAADVAFTMGRAKASPNVSMVLGMIDLSTVEVINDYTIRIGTYEPFAPFLYHLAHTSAGILSASNETDDPIGTGPFRFDSQIASDRIVLTRFDEYHGTPPAIEQLIFRIITEPAVRQIELETGGIHVDLAPLPDNFARINATETLSLLSTTGLRTNYIGMNTTHPYLSDVRIRQAINYAVDRQPIFTEILLSNGQLAHTHIAPSIWGHHPEIAPREQNLQRASELMQATGHENLALTLTLGTDALEVTGLALTLRQQLAEINIDLSIEVLEWPVFLETVMNGDTDLFFIGWTADTADADYGLYSLFHSNMFGASGNLSFFNHPRIDELLDAARREPTPETRLTMYREVEEILQNELPWLLINHPDVHLALCTSLGGIIPAQTGTHDFRQAYWITE
ncbi:MAG: ABC transporter substrate-binding protein [Turicibacter sp.]|nr:ABC transporter substrate-binding protein [Turicibacter sp.]